VICPLHTSSPLLVPSPAAHAEICTAEIRQHLRLLRVRGQGTLVLIANILTPDSLEPGLPEEARDLLQDSVLLQVGRQTSFDQPRLMQFMDSAHDEDITIRIKSKLFCPNYPISALILYISPSVI
jgi:hypothetical protein